MRALRRAVKNGAYKVIHQYVQPHYLQAGMSVMHGRQCAVLIIREVRGGSMQCSLAQPA